MKHCIIILSFILLSDYAISQEQTDSTTTKKKGYHFGLILFDIGTARVQKLKQPNNDSHFLAGEWLPVVTLASLHNLHKDWDIGFKAGIFDIGGQEVTSWSSFSLATYGYYYPFEKRYFIRFGLEHNVPVDLFEDNKSSSRYYNKFNSRTSLSLGVGLNRNNDNYLLHIAISVPLYNKYDQKNISYPNTTRLYYVITGGFTWLFI